MSTDALRPNFWDKDSPWRRLPWTLPWALVILTAMLLTFVYSIGKPNERLPEPPAIEAQIIEIPEPVKTIPAPEKPTVQPKRVITPPVVVPQPSLEKIPPPVKEVKPIAEAVPIPQPEVQKVSPPPVSEEPNSKDTNMTGTSGAQVISRPMPKIPDELRHDALSASALARFHVAIDGTVTVELVNPTPNPRLNRLLLDTLKSWRFFPAMKDGKPVASTQEIVIKVEVK
jgi:protein TonB